MQKNKIKSELLCKFYNILDETFDNSIKGNYPYQIFNIITRNKYYSENNLNDKLIDQYKTIIYSQNNDDIFEVKHFGLIKEFRHFNLHNKTILYKRFVYIQKEYSLN